MIYRAIDLWNSPDSLQHYKYVKKIKIGGHTRYFYSLADLKAYYNQLNGKSKQIDNGIARDIHDNTQDYIRSEYNGKKYGYLAASVHDQKMVTAKNADYKLRNKNNKAEALLNTSKFAAKNVLGSNSKKDLEQKFNKSQTNDLKKHRKKANRIRKRMYIQLNEISKNARNKLDW